MEQKPTPPIQTEDEQPSDEPTQTPIQPESKPEEEPKPQPPIDNSEDFNPLPPINHPADSEKEEESESENSNEDLMLSDQVSQSEQVDN